MSIRDNVSLDMRKKIANKIINETDSIPIIFTPLPYNKFSYYYTFLSYFINVRSLNIEKKYKINKNLNLKSECYKFHMKGVNYFYIKTGELLNMNLNVNDLYDLYKDDDGFLYIEYL